MNLNASEVSIVDFEPKTESLLQEVLIGLSKGQKTIHPKYLYDKKGSEIFEKICDLKEYYPTRTEREILRSNAEEISELLGEDVLLIEPGSGSSTKIRDLLPYLKNPKAYVPVEISRSMLLLATQELHDIFPDLKVLPVCADFTQDVELPLTVESQTGKKVIFFPGSTIGNLQPDDAIGLLENFKKLVGKNGGLLIGVDMKKDRDLFIGAYNDSEGITADFNLNLLERLNREIDASFDVSNFRHEAIYNEELGRVEMHLVSTVPQLVRVDQTTFRFKEGETIHTENSYKYAIEEFCELCAKAKFSIKKFWTDPEKLFCVYYFEQQA